MENGAEVDSITPLEIPELSGPTVVDGPYGNELGRVGLTAVDELKLGKGTEVVDSTIPLEIPELRGPTVVDGP